MTPRYGTDDDRVGNIILRNFLQCLKSFAGPRFRRDEIESPTLGRGLQTKFGSALKRQRKFVEIQQLVRRAVPGRRNEHQVRKPASPRHDGRDPIVH